jgi:hypothetical protein
MFYINNANHPAFFEKTIRPLANGSPKTIFYLSNKTKIFVQVRNYRFERISKSLQILKFRINVLKSAEICTLLWDLDYFCYCGLAGLIF